MNKTIFLLLLMVSFQGVACKCAYLGEFNTKEVESFDYVALVRLLDFSPNGRTDSLRKREELFFWAEIEEKAIFKGNSISKIKIHGGRREFGYGSSCDFGMKKGEEWILFAKSDGERLLVSPCNRTALYRNSDGSLAKDESNLFWKLKKLKSKA
ncbi:hypothetical protein Aoki45_10880 [Algoriphagus sp. oki45]|uniref:hypothetical protein n=1 Tax=Algoriphagus sp. oki45 TaxID=3067294 RepID=UPI0027EB792D|nr:hypothetical protein Aoki45_10880 [Algoriphagus sp. oki45]